MNGVAFAVGLEVEGFLATQPAAQCSVLTRFTPEFLVGLNMAPGNSSIPGRFSPELGQNQLELITDPCASACAATAVAGSLADMVRARGHQVIFSTRHPDLDRISLSELEIGDDPRYRAIVEACAMRSPKHWRGVLEMTRTCSVHVNVGIDPRTPEGMLVMNIFRNIAPHFAAWSHLESVGSEGHIARWAGTPQWVGSEYLPSYDDWFRNWDHFVDWFESGSKLINISGGQYQPLRQGKIRRSIDSAIDRGTLWHLARPKQNDVGEWYIELRFLPSLDPKKTLLHHVEKVVNGVHIVVEYARASGNVSWGRHGYEALMKTLHVYSDFYPDHMLSRDEWEQYICM